MRLFPENLPLKDSPSWSLWKKEIRDGKPAKVPYQADGKRAKSNDSSTWTKFSTALTAYQDVGGFDGICWMMPVKPSGIIFIDIDNCIKDGKIDPWAQKIVDEFASYTETSQSEKGLHILITGKKPIKRCRKHGSPFEIYDSLRPCYLTGDVVDGRNTIEARPEPLNRLFNEIFAEEMQRADEPHDGARPGKSSLTDDALILKATLAKNGKEFKALYDGVTLGYGGDDSAADMALMNKLAFWCRGDALQMERIFSSSGLGRRAKWRDRADYRERTIKKAISDAREFYEPPKDDGDSPKAKEVTETPGQEIEKAAKNIMERGDVLKFLVHQAQKNHIGDTDVIKHLLASIACTNSRTSSGIQPELNGEKGHGKTDAVKAVFHIVPAKWKLAASVSAKALYYYKDLPEGAIIFSDDVEWSTDLIATVKRSMGNFQEPQTHFTLDKNRNPLPQVMPARLVWWLSSVESVADDQLKDRQYSLDIDEGGDHTKEVSDYLRESRAEKKIRFSVDKGIETAREITRDVKEHEPFKVVIDCAKVADWKVKEDHRTQNKFWDLVEAFAILRYRQRHIDADGWLHASVEDFNEAKAIFMRRKANHRTHLTNAQTKIVKSVIALQRETDGATRARIAEDLGISFQAVSKALKAIEANTRFIVHEPRPHGELFYRCTVSALEVAYEEGDIVSLPEGYQDHSTTVRPPFNPYSTNHSTTKTTINNNKHTYIQPKREKHSNEEIRGDGSKIEVEHCSAQKNTEKRLNGSLDNGSKVECEVERRFNERLNGSLDNGSMAEHKVESIFCAKCGEDLTGHSMIESAGKHFCTRPGCGYSPREEAGA